MIAYSISKGRDWKQKPRILPGGTNASTQSFSLSERDLLYIYNYV